MPLAFLFSCHVKGKLKLKLNDRFPLAGYIIMCKDLRLIFRDRSALIFLFGLPLVFAFLFGTAFGGSGSKGQARSTVKVLVSNEDKGVQGKEFIAAMQRMGVDAENAVGGSIEVARRVRAGDRAVGVVVPPDFSAQLEQTVTSLSSGSTAGTQAHLRVVIDPAQLQLAGLAQGAISGAAQRVAGNLFRKQLGIVSGVALPEAAAENERPPVALDVMRAVDADMPGNHDKKSPGDLIIPGLAVYFVFFTANGVAATLITERQEGTLRRMLSAPITPGQILTGKMLARGLLGLIQVAMLFAVGKAMIHFSLGSSPLGLVLTAISTVFAATGLGLLIASFGKTLDQIQGMTTFALLLMGLLSGCLFPRVLLPDTIQKLSVITPHAWALNAYQDLMLRHLPLSGTLVNIGMVMLFGVAFYGFALARFKYE